MLVFIKKSYLCCAIQSSMMKRTILFTLLVSCFLTHALAQRFMVKSLDVTNGLSSDYVMQMAMDKYGFIWVATEEGLNRFDGSRFFSYYHVKDRNSITANELNCLLDDPQLLRYRWPKIRTFGSQLIGRDSNISTEKESVSTISIRKPYADWFPIRCGQLSTQVTE